MSEVQHFQAEAEEIRNRIASSVEALGERLSPSRLIRDAKDEGMRALLGVRDDGLHALRGVREDSMRALADVRDRGSDVVAGIEDFARENPLAAGVAAAFVGVLIVYNRPRLAGRAGGYDDGDDYTAFAARAPSRAHQFAFGLGDRIGDARDAMAERLASAKIQAADALADARESLSETRDRAAAKAASLRSRIAERVCDVSDSVSAGLDSARDSAADTAQSARRSANRAAKATIVAIGNEPEAAVAVALVAGAFLALVAEGGAFDRGRD